MIILLKNTITKLTENVFDMSYIFLILADEGALTHFYTILSMKSLTKY